MGKRELVILIFSLIFVGNSAYSQVGINTENPQATLDVDGDFQLRGEFRAGSSTDDDDAVGKVGQYLMSKGPGLPPVWSTVENIDLGTDDYILRDTEFAEDSTGVVLNANDIKISPIEEGAYLTSDWTVLDGLSTIIKTSKDKNHIMFTTQTVIQNRYTATNSASDWSTVVCGIFIGAKDANRDTYTLVAARQGTILGGHYPQLAYILMSSYDDLPKGEYKVVVAYQRRGGSVSHTSLPLYVGRGFSTGTGTEVANDFMNKSVIQVDVFEPEK